MAEPLTRSEPVRRFVTRARDYCELVENVESLSPTILAEELAELP